MATSPTETAERMAHRSAVAHHWFHQKIRSSLRARMFCGINPALKCRAIVIASLGDGQTRVRPNSAGRPIRPGPAIAWPLAFCPGPCVRPVFAAPLQKLFCKDAKAQIPQNRQRIKSAPVGRRPLVSGDEDITTSPRRFCICRCIASHVTLPQQCTSDALSAHTTLRQIDSWLGRCRGRRHGPALWLPPMLTIMRACFRPR